MHEKILKQPMLHANETRLQVFIEIDKTPQGNSFMWVLCSAQFRCKAALYLYEPTRSGKATAELLRDYRGALMVDGYSGYNAVCEQESTLTWVDWTLTALRAAKETSKRKPTCIHYKWAA